MGRKTVGTDTARVIRRIPKQWMGPILQAEIAHAQANGKTLLDVLETRFHIDAGEARVVIESQDYR